MLQIFELLGKINSMLLRSVVPIVKAEGLSGSEMLILWKIYKKGAYKTTELAKDADLPPSTITGIIDRLVARNYLIRINGMEDRRSVLVECTQELKQLIERILSAVDVKLVDVFKSLPDDFLQNTIKDLQVLYQYLLQNEGYDNCEGGLCAKGCE